MSWVLKLRVGSAETLCFAVTLPVVAVVTTEARAGVDFCPIRAETEIAVLYSFFNVETSRDESVINANVSVLQRESDAAAV